MKKREFYNVYWNCVFFCFVLIVYSYVYVVYMFRDK